MHTEHFVGEWGMVPHGETYYVRRKDIVVTLYLAKLLVKLIGLQ